jgi:acetyltransferase-like isoleucine patch superfamily enzyme
MKEKLKFLLRNPFKVFSILITKLPYFSFIRETNDYQCRVNLSFWFNQKVLGIGGNKKVYWPVHPTSTVYDSENIFAGVDTCPGFSKGCYIQGMGGIHIGDYTQIAPNVVIVSANHDPYDSRKHILQKVKIGKYCWLGAGAKIMPGVELGDWTIVGAGAVVTKSFPNGYCVLGGVAAKVIKELDRDKCIPFENKKRYFGYIKEERFDEYRKKHLNF